MPSSEYRALRTRIGELRRYLLPKQFDPTGSYRPRQFDRARAFRLLTHAEIEWYLEQVVFETANKAYDIWSTRGLITEPIVAMLAYHEGQTSTIPETLSGAGPPDLQNRIQKSRDYINTYARVRNNGIRERQILRLLLPVGIKEADIDPVWLSTTDSFGHNRGESAHRSNKVTNPPDPQNELTTVMQVVDGLLNIDELLLSYRSM